MAHLCLCLPVCLFCVAGAADGPKFTDEERELIKEHIPFLELSEEGEAALVHCIDSGDRLVHAALEVYHAEADDHDFQDTLRRVAQRAVSVGPILEPLSSPRRGGNAGEDLPAGLEATGEGDADHAAWEGRDGIAKVRGRVLWVGVGAGACVCRPRPGCKGWHASCCVAALVTALHCLVRRGLMARAVDSCWTRW